jgi:6-phosphogluconolactonase (cycloisomerase 2 family)
LCANQDSDNIVVFEIDYDTGMLYRKSEVTIPTPVCVKPYIF